MGSRNPDNISIAERRPRCETAAAMLRDRRQVRAVCIFCHTTTSIDLQRVIRKLGPAACLWDREQSCRRAGCSGKVWFEARAPGMTMFQPLRGQPAKREPAYRRGRE